MIKFFKLWLPLIAWMGLIFFLSSIPDLKTSLPTIWDLILRKIAHIFEFGILFLLFSRVLNRGKQINLFLAAIFSIAYAFSDEYHQKFVFGRSCSLKDVGFDTFGVLISYFLLFKKHKN